MQRLGAIAGKDERQLTFEVWQQWLKAGTPMPVKTYRT